VRFTLFRKLRLSNLQLSTRVLLTCFVLSIDVGLWVGSLKYTQRAEFSAAGAQDYWRGRGDAASGELLPGESQIEDAAATTPPASPRKSTKFLVDTVHPHLFTVPIVLFILLHLLSLTRLPEGVKVALDVHAFVSFAATFGLPFLIAGSGRGAAAFVASGVNLLLNVIVVSVILLFETWRRDPDARQRDGETRSSAIKGR
jgi:hypothetical protein